MPLSLDKHDPQRDLLRQLLRGVKLAPEDVDRIAAEMKEDVHLDYKSGLILDDDRGQGKPGHPKTFHGKIKKHVAGLANADGGVLVVGVGDPQHADSGGKRRVDGLKGESDAILGKVREAIKELRPYLTSATPMHVVHHADGLVLVVGVDRSDSRVLVVEGGRTLHYLRIHDSTTHAPDYLVEDLALGRWRKPELLVRVEVEFEQVGRDPKLKVTVANVGLVWAEEPKVGTIWYARKFVKDGHLPKQVEQAVVSLRDLAWTEYNWASFVSGDQATEGLVMHGARVPLPDGVSSVGTFEEAPSVLLPCPGFRWGERDVWLCAALYVSCRGSVPQWYQLLLMSFDTSGNLSDEGMRGFYFRNYNQHYVKLVPCHGVRPRVGVVKESKGEAGFFTVVDDEVVITAED